MFSFLSSTKKETSFDNATTGAIRNSSGETPTTAAAAEKKIRGPPVNVLVIDGDKRHDWSALFKDKIVSLRERPKKVFRRKITSDEEDTKKTSPSAEADDDAPTSSKISSEENEETSSTHSSTQRAISVVQVGWNYIQMTSYANDYNGVGHLELTVKDVHGRIRNLRPDFVLIRNECRGSGKSHDYREILYAMLHAGIPSVNSLESVALHLDRPIIHGALVKLERKLGPHAFPIVQQTCYATYKDMVISPSFPCVVKVGHAHAGQGKMLLHDNKQFEDLKSVVAIADTYCTAESFVVGAYDLRIQKIGSHVRVFKRQTVSGNWKTNTGTSISETVETTETYRRWAEEASKIFGGLDICTVDAIHCARTGKEYIIEVNGTSSGLHPDFWKEDSERIRDLVLKRIEMEVFAGGVKDDEWDILNGLTSGRLSRRMHHRNEEDKKKKKRAQEEKTERREIVTTSFEEERRGGRGNSRGAPHLTLPLSPPSTKGGGSPSPPRNRVVHQKKESTPNYSSKIGALLLQGWTMLQETCPTTRSVPLMRDLQGRKFSVATNAYVLGDGEEEDAVDDWGRAPRRKDSAVNDLERNPRCDKKEEVPGKYTHASSKEIEYDATKIATSTTAGRGVLEDECTKPSSEEDYGNEIGVLLLKGWTMLGECCPVTHAVPLMQNREGRKFSVALNKFVDEFEEEHENDEIVEGVIEPLSVESASSSSLSSSPRKRKNAEVSSFVAAAADPTHSRAALSSTLQSDEAVGVVSSPKRRMKNDRSLNGHSSSVNVGESLANSSSDADIYLRGAESSLWTKLESLRRRLDTEADPGSCGAIAAAMLACAKSAKGIRSLRP
eukprot:g812.t1